MNRVIHCGIGKRDAESRKHTRYLSGQRPQRGRSPVEHRGTFLCHSVCPSVRRSPQPLSGPKSALSGLKFTLSGLKSALSALESMRADFRPERTDFRSERADFRPERADSRPERADFRPVRVNFRPKRAWGTNRKTNE